MSPLNPFFTVPAATPVIKLMDLNSLRILKGIDPEILMAFL
jgi:hypothetical protein